MSLRLFVPQMFWTSCFLPLHRTSPNEKVLQNTPQPSSDPELLCQATGLCSAGACHKTCSSHQVHCGVQAKCANFCLKRRQNQPKTDYKNGHTDVIGPSLSLKRRGSKPKPLQNARLRSKVSFCPKASIAMWRKVLACTVWHKEKEIFCRLDE